MGTINAGDLDTRIRIERDSPTKDGHGNTSATGNWVLYTRVWARRLDGGGRDTRQAAQDSASLTAVFRIRRSARTAEVTPDFRLVVDGAPWDIQAVARFGNDALDISATTQQAGGRV